VGIFLVGSEDKKNVLVCQGDFIAPDISWKSQNSHLLPMGETAIRQETAVPGIPLDPFMTI
jgi:hypothetical protein